MIYIENNCTDPSYNLAFEEYVFERFPGEEPILLLWRNGPSVIVGKYQNTLEEVDYEYAQSKGIRVIRRGTGGGAVYHDTENLNYSFIIPNVDSKIDFGTFSIPVVKALRAHGVPAEQTGRNDLLADGIKFSGNAQRFSRGRLLHHGTLMFNVDREEMARVLTVKPGKFKSKATKSVRSRTVNLKQLLRNAGHGEIESAMDLKRVLLEWFSKEYDLSEMNLSEEQLAQVRELQAEKYMNDAWNLGRSPEADITRGDFFRCGEVRFHFSIENMKIRNVCITGDFFSARDITEFESMFTGLAYERDALLTVLKQADLQGYFGDITAEELIDVIV